MISSVLHHAKSKQRIITFASTIYVILSTSSFSSTAGFIIHHSLDSGKANIGSGSSDSIATSIRNIRIEMFSTKSVINDSIDDPLANLGLPTPLILGSGSFTRKLILKEMNVPFMLKVKPIDEKSIGTRDDATNAKELVLTLAKAKADALIRGILQSSSDSSSSSSSKNNDNSSVPFDDKFDLTLPINEEYIILTADQVVISSNKILEKPNSVKEAKENLSLYIKSPPSTVGAVVLTHLPSKKQVYDIDISTIYFKSSLVDDDSNGHENLIDRLLNDNAPVLECAGGLMIEHRFVKEHIDMIDGSEDGVMGLSKNLVLKLLKEMKELL